MDRRYLGSRAVADPRTAVTPYVVAGPSTVYI